jgi:sec-independent protein translocase protein TatA
MEMNKVQFATFGMWELLLILLIVVVIFGAGRLPQLADSLGKSIRIFKRSLREEPKEIQNEEKENGRDESSGPTARG